MLSFACRPAAFCSNVSGAFDYVPGANFLTKLFLKGLRPGLAVVTQDWSGIRSARVLVGGAVSESFSITNSVFQGIVWGVPPRIFFFETARPVVNSTGHVETVYVDDLMCF